MKQINMNGLKYVSAKVGRFLKKRLGALQPSCLCAVGAADEIIRYKRGCPSSPEEESDGDLCGVDLLDRVAPEQTFTGEAVPIGDKYKALEPLFDEQLPTEDNVLIASYASGLNREGSVMRKLYVVDVLDRVAPKQTCTEEATSLGDKRRLKSCIRQGSSGPKKRVSFTGVPEPVRAWVPPHRRPGFVSRFGERQPETSPPAASLSQADDPINSSP